MSAVLVFLPLLAPPIVQDPVPSHQEVLKEVRKRAERDRKRAKGQLDSLRAQLSLDPRNRGQAVDEAVRRAALLGPAAIPRLLAWLDPGQGDGEALFLSRSSAAVLSLVADGSLVPELVRRTREGGIFGRWNAVSVLGAIGDSAAETPLVALLDDPDLEVAALDALAAAGGEECVEAVARRLSSASYATRKSALNSLGSIGTTTCATAITKFLTGPGSDTLAGDAAEILARLGGEDSLPGLLAALQRPGILGNRRVALLRAVATLAPRNTRTARETVRPLTFATDRDVRREAWFTLHALGDARAADSALGPYDDYVKGYPRLPSAFIDRAYVHNRLDRRSKARQDLKKARSLAEKAGTPLGPDWHIEWAFLLCADRNWKEAAATLQTGRITADQIQEHVWRDRFAAFMERPESQAWQRR